MCPTHDTQETPDEDASSHASGHSAPIDQHFAKAEDALGRVDKMLLRISEAMKRIASSTPHENP
jgi:hypothetical protein